MTTTSKQTTKYTVKAQMPNGKWQSFSFTFYSMATKFAEGCMARKCAVKINNELIADVEGLQKWNGKAMRAHYGA